MTDLHQIYYDERHRPKLLPYSIPYKNEGLTVYFENYVIAQVVPSTKADKVGVCSWKLADKMRRLHLENLHMKKDSDYQVLSLTRNSARHQMLAMANAWHPGFIKTIKLLWEKLGLKIPGEAKYPVYQNHWIGQTPIYKKYVDEFLIPAMDLVEKDEELRNLMLQPSGYGKLNRQSDLRSVKNKLGLDDYPLCPFIFERCPSLWFDINKIHVTYL